MSFSGEGSFAERWVQLGRLRVRGADRNAGNGATANIRTQLAALDVAHRWQVQHAVIILEQELVQELQENSGWFTPREVAEHLRAFELICDSASLKDLPLLLGACRHFAATSLEVQMHFERGGFGPTAVSELCGLF